MDKQTDRPMEMGKTQGCKKMGYYLTNKPKNLLNYYQIPTYLYSHSDPMGTNKQTNIYSIFRDKLSLPEGSLDWTPLASQVKVLDPPPCPPKPKSLLLA